MEMDGCQSSGLCSYHCSLYLNVRAQGRFYLQEGESFDILPEMKKRNRKSQIVRDEVPG